MNILSFLDVGAGLITGKTPNPTFENIFTAFSQPSPQPAQTQAAPGSPTTASGQAVAPIPPQQSQTASAPITTSAAATTAPLAGETPGVDYLSNLLKALTGI